MAEGRESDADQSMRMNELHYKPGDGINAKAIAAVLASLGEVELRHDPNVERTLLDSFDWRLYRAGLYLQEIQGDEPLSECRSLRDERRVAAMAGPVPRFAEQLPYGPLRDALGPLLKMRALLPVVRLKGEVSEICLLDKREKIIVRLQLRREQILNTLAPKSLPPRLHLIPLRGFDREARQVQKRLEKELKLKPARRHPLEQALAAIGRSPVEYSSKVAFELKPDMPAAAAMHCILSQLFHTMEQNEQGIIEDTDSEFLHDFRVAVRRSRTALTQLKRAISSADRWRLQPDFQWLGDITTPLRDLDVWLQKFDSYRAVLPEAMRDDLHPLHELIQAERNRARRRLVRQLQSQDYGRIKRHVGLALEHLREDENGGGPTARRMADRRIGKVYARVLAEGAAIGKKSPPEALHELRKRCKKLRYLLEFFRSLYPEQQIKSQIRQLKRLQDTLGAIQDARVQLQTLQGWREELHRNGAAAGALAAIDWLAEDIRHISKEARQGFAESFRHFAADKRQRQMREMLKA